VCVCVCAVNYGNVCITDVANIAFVILFTGEMFLKMYSLGFLNYFVSMFNRFDFFATISSILEIIFHKLGLIQPLGVSVLRSARLLRIFKVTKYKHSFCFMLTSRSSLQILEFTTKSSRLIAQFTSINCFTAIAIVLVSCYFCIVGYAGMCLTRYSQHK
jgi:hypothetical protein